MLKRSLATSAKQEFSYHSNYKFKCGLEIHTQLKTKYKLFSLSRTSFNEPSNTRISYFDIGLPGTQPILNPEALYLALRASVALNCDVQPISKFDRKHYFYPDQPLGYQITQQFHPLAKNGYLNLTKFDNTAVQGRIHIERVHLEQDTGKKHGNEIDYNRAGTPLIEVVTKPDFENIDQVLAFVKKYQLLVRYLNVCSGDLETGAIRVDVNVNVNNHPRVELKNLATTGDIVRALQYEYNRQIEVLESGGRIEQQTRNWDGFSTNLARTKENAVDYRYFPDCELPPIVLEENITEDIKSLMPEYPEDLLKRLTSKPHLLQLVDAKRLIAEPKLLHYYETFFKLYNHPDANKWIFQEMLTAFAKENKTFDTNIVSSKTLACLANLNMSLVSKRLVLRYMIRNDEECLKDALKALGLEEEQNGESFSVEDLCRDIINANPKIIKRIQSGHIKATEVLVGQAIKATRGKVDADTIRKKFVELL
ncbi:PET112 [Candida oxycetoniae]|uniref:Glutamyl-tRNA(Gln) amidotransferase subunit B, mitochondrial n=1 Tax=Candida oxycetoniae TaxID=497107 RepID=A0AAI9T2H9_9ASCO|nr:PET112 [Candida oxycetoniae]KAI3407020.1 PET112 [Candida oxycetoniae]